MKVVNAFIHIFSIFVFLTVGSLLLIISFHIVAPEEILKEIAEVYAEPLRALQTGLIGILFIIIGLTFARILLRSTKGDDALVFQSEAGTITVSALAIEDLAKKVIQKYEAVKEAHFKTIIQNRSLSLRVKLTVFSGFLIPEVITELERELKEKLERMLGLSERTEILIAVKKIVLSKKA